MQLPNKDAEEELLESLKNVQRVMLTPEGQVWFAKSLAAYRLKRWENVYQDIVKNLSAEPEGPKGKKIAQAWRELIDEQTGWAPPEFNLGMQMWQQLEQSQAALKELKKAPAPVTDQQIEKIKQTNFF